MRILGLFLMVITCFMLLGGSAHAEPKPWIWSWWPSHWRNLDFQPYLGDNKISQRGLWDGDTWTPEAWIKDAGDAQRIMHDLYAVDIIRDQYTDGDNIPALVVGPKFMQLSGLDQRRVLAFVDHVFAITTSETNGMFFVFYSEDENDPIGLYNQYGFQQS